MQGDKTVRPADDSGEEFQAQRLCLTYLHCEQCGLFRATGSLAKESQLSLAFSRFHNKLFFFGYECHLHCEYCFRVARTGNGEKLFGHIGSIPQSGVDITQFVLFPLPLR